MKRYVFIGIFLVFATASVQAQPTYVSEIVEITLRTGAGIDHKVIAMVKSGQPLVVLEPGPEWTKVRLPNEKEGYILSRFLTDKRPNELLLDELKEKYKNLESKGNAIREENSKQKNQNEGLLSELAAKEEQLSGLTASYDALKADSAEFLNLKTNYKQTVAQLTEQTQKAEQCEEAYSKLQKWQIIRWVLTGAGILLVGVLIGMTSKRQRRRSTLLL
ncbi:MAG TPA: TIGR04211 family SH3 domain-containing protein [Deltaproteobacteria bacterium]|nr:TIGR04211 family SH3 domain-containing protein [Deltaproteobacteria bacterium]